MKQLTSLVISAIFLTISLSASAADHTRTTAAKGSVTETSSTSRLGIGLTTFGTGGIGNGAEVPGAGLWWDLSSVHSLQFLAGIAGTNPFQFGAGAVYRARFIGNHNAGLHAGLGFNMGLVSNGAVGAAAATSYFCNIFPVIGIVYSPGGEASRIQFSFDMGPIFAITPNFTFGLRPLSQMVGLGIHFFL